MTPVNTDPAPIVTPYRVVFFLYTLASALIAVPSVSPDVKTLLAIGMVVLSAVLLVFFNVAPNAAPNPSIIARVSNRGKKEQG